MVHLGAIQREDNTFCLRPFFGLSVIIAGFDVAIYEAERRMRPCTRLLSAESHQGWVGQARA